MTRTGAVEAFWDTVQRAYGAYLDAMAGFHLFREKFAQSQEQIASLLGKTQQELDALRFIFGESDPESPEAMHLHRVTQGELKHRNRDDGGNAIFVGAMCLVAIYQFWEDRFRAEIALELNLGKGDLRHEVLGDIRLIRIAIVHHGGVAKSGIEGCRRLRWFKAGDTIEMTADRMKQVVFALFEVCRRWLRDRGAITDGGHPASHS